MLFSAYAHYYDLLYRDKDYPGEARFVKTLIERHVPDAKCILELGCGEGRHAAYLAQAGFSVRGVDLSPEMIRRAKVHANGAPREVKQKLSFLEGDIRTLALGKTFDAVVSLFHVVSYQVTNKELRDTFAVAARHLRPGGIFLFDCWYGPTVLTEPPAVRVKRAEDEQRSITRISEPEMFPNDNAVTVKYTLFIRNKETRVIETVRENHRMRYLFTPEVDVLFSEAGMERIETGEWMTGQDPGLHTFSVFFAGQKERKG